MTGLILDKELGPLFLRHLSESLPADCGFTVPAVTKEQKAHFRSLPPDLHNGVANLFRPKWHTDYRAAFKPDTDYQALAIPCNFKNDLIAYWRTHQLGKHRGFWKHVAGQVTFNFHDAIDQAKLPDAVQTWAIEQHYVKIVTNLDLEGQFNLINIYGKAQIDQVRQEMVMEHVNNELRPDRKRRKTAEFRVKTAPAQRSQHLKGFDDLEKSTHNKPQLADYASSALKAASRFTSQQLLDAGIQAVERSKKRKEVSISYYEDANDMHFDDCHKCGEPGDVMKCDYPKCRFVYHAACAGLVRPPEGNFYCPQHDS